MLNPDDLIRIPYTSDLTEGGIAYAVRSLPFTYNRMGGSPFDRLRRIVAGVAVELAFRRYLSEQNVPFDVKGATPFTEPDRYDAALGGHRCDVKSFLITYRRQISDMRRNPEITLNAPALIPLDQFEADGHSGDDLYLFAFLAGLVTASQDELKKAIDAGQPHYLIHVMPREWRKPMAWSPLGPLALKSESPAARLFEIAGQDEDRGFLTRTVKLPGGKRVVIDDPFFALTSVRAMDLPGARLGIRSLARNESHVINPLEWGNIWVYGMEILFAGYISRVDFRRRACLVPPMSQVFQYRQTRVKNLAVPVSELKPLRGLFEKVREWEERKIQPDPGHL